MQDPATTADTACVADADYVQRPFYDASPHNADMYAI